MVVGCFHAGRTCIFDNTRGQMADKSANRKVEILITSVYHHVDYISMPVSTIHMAFLHLSSCRRKK